MKIRRLYISLELILLNIVLAIIVKFAVQSIPVLVVFSAAKTDTDVLFGILWANFLADTIQEH